MVWRGKTYDGKFDEKLCFVENLKKRLRVNFCLANVDDKNKQVLSTMKFHKFLKSLL